MSRASGNMLLNPTPGSTPPAAFGTDGDFCWDGSVNPPVIYGPRAGSAGTVWPGPFALDPSGGPSEVTNSVPPLTAHALVKGNGTSDILALPLGTSNNLLRGNTGADPSWGKVDLATDLTTDELPAANFPVLTGDVTTAGATLVTVIAPTGVGAGTYTKVTVNTKGQVTAGASAVLASADYANQGTATTVLHGNAAGNPTFGAVNLTTDITGILPVGNSSILTGDVTSPGGTGVTTIANTGVAAGTYTKITVNAKGQATVGASAVLASADYANQGTTTTVLHGNAAGNPSFGAVVLTTDVTGVLPAANMQALTASGVGHQAGIAPDPGAAAGTTRFLREDATWAAPTATAAGTLVRAPQVITASGNYTIPATCTKILVECIGGGGGGGGVANAAGSSGAGGGGGSGGYSRKFYSGLTPLTVIAVVIGAGGAAGANTGGNGGNGGNTIFDNTNVLGAGGTIAGHGNGGGGDTATAAAHVGGQAGNAGALGSGADFTQNGDAGSAGLVLSATVAAAGQGAPGLLGGTSQVSNGGGAGANAPANSGSGGNGGNVTNASGAVVGGTGGTGLIIVTEYT